jgi:hypothetical protein
LGPTYQIRNGSGAAPKLEHNSRLVQELANDADVSSLQHNCVRVAAVFSMTEKPNSPRKAPPKGEAGLEEARLRQQAIGVKLRHMFDEVVNEPVPDEFLDILRRADAGSKGGGA